MSLAESRITAQGQISIPVSVMRQFGLAPGGAIRWECREGRLVLEKGGRYSLEEIREALDLPGNLHRSAEDIREGIQNRMRAKHALR